jgi:hypothetical protein
VLFRELITGLAFFYILEANDSSYSMEKPIPDRSCGKLVVVIAPPEYISPCDGSCPNRSHNGYWSPPIDSLMGYGSIVKCHIFLHHVVEMTFIQDEDVIKPFLSS